jgi:hypothetical protein
MHFRIEFADPRSASEQSAWNGCFIRSGGGLVALSLEMVTTGLRVCRGRTGAGLYDKAIGCHEKAATGATVAAIARFSCGVGSRGFSLREAGSGYAPTARTR